LNDIEDIFEDTKHKRSNTNKGPSPFNLGISIILTVSLNQIVAAAFSLGIPPMGEISTPANVPSSETSDVTLIKRANHWERQA
jgi:hypothetical protein